MEFLLLATEKWHLDDVRPNVVVPFANDATDPLVHGAMRQNLEMQGLSPRWERLTGPFAYDALIRRLWAEGRPFILVEHDVLPWPGAVQQLWTCDRPWCAYEYFMLGELCVALGCTKFDPARLGPCPLPDEPTDWHRMDWYVIDTLTTRYHSAHLHEPAVSHLNRAHTRMTSPEILRPVALP
jgi:hypothetical protein